MGLFGAEAWLLTVWWLELRLAAYVAYSCRTMINVNRMFHSFGHKLFTFSVGVSTADYKSIIYMGNG